MMKSYLISLGAGLLIGMIYTLLNVRSPAPPLIALVGLLGIVCGEQIIPLGRQILEGKSLVVSWHQSACHEHVFGELPGRFTRPEMSAVETQNSGEQS
jgi:XapX domain-containing protein